ncbi:DUF6350 family protein [Arthrobacter rhombi]|uniref:cell division protein PerM n=1 Tax=Arthrobacter rhombi TaxID=71253 RepID=UPI0031D26982
MPLWLQGALEFIQCAFFSAALVVIPLMAVWFSDGFAQRTLDSVFRMCGQVWLLIHGVPLHLNLSAGSDSPVVVTGLLSFIPLGLTLIPFFLAWRSGRRIARASYTDQLWQGIAGALGAYLLVGLVTGFAVPTEEVGVNLGAAALIPLIPAGLGVIVGARREAGSWGRLVGVDFVEWVATTSQHSRWAGSYLWSVIRAGMVGYAATFCLAALGLTVSLVMRWLEISNIYQQLQPGPIGGAVLTIAQLGVIPNLVLWSLAWISGGGIALGVGSTLGPLGTAVGPVPAMPVLGALPAGNLDSAWVFMLLPVLAGILAGWWFLREGENHFEDWISIRLKVRWVALAVSTLLLGLFIGAVAGVVSLLGSWLAGGSLGIGRLTELGPDVWMTAVLLTGEVGLGVIIGYLVAPFLERDPVLED